MYYQDKLQDLQDVFGTDQVSLEGNVLRVGPDRYPIIDDVIVLGEPGQHPAAVRARLDGAVKAGGPFAEDIQFTFGEEWKQYGALLPEHEREFAKYFDIVDIDGLRNQRVADLGCGMGRWSYFLKDRCRQLVLVDFSEAIFVARRNLKDVPNALFFLGDIQKLPFRDDFAGFTFSLGVLHHLPTDCLEAVVALRRFAPQLLIFLYYALDNRPWYFRALLSAVTAVRRTASRVRNPFFRKAFSLAGAGGIYLPLITLGRLLRPLGLSSQVPLYDFYHDKSLARIEQDVYDRFFTRIEQRVTRDQVLGLRKYFTRVIVSDNLPYWHFLCFR